MSCWVEMVLFSLKCHEVSSSEFCRVYGFGMALGSLSFNAQDGAPDLLEKSCFGLVGCCVELGFIVGMECLG